MHKIAPLLFLLFPLTVAGGGADTAGKCRVSFPPRVADQANIFSPDQEVDLGDAIAESTLLELRILAEGDPTLDRIAKRLAASAPLPGLRIRTFIVEAPMASAMATPGGRVYVSRALIQLTRNEDELAGIMAHEFGHLLAHQYAIRISRLMKATMRVTKVRDRRDIFEKYHRLIESLWTKPRAVSSYDLTHPDPTARADEFQADRLGLEIQAAAGYDPMAPIRLFDRLAETRGKTGNFISNFFNYTPDEKRLGLMLKNMPTDCTLAPAHGSAEFLQWRERILGNTSVRFQESLDGTLSRRMLTPPLVGDVRRIRFTANGRYILVQDASGISVLSTQPLAVLFRVAAQNASQAEFTPDGGDIVFVRSGTHVERWNIADRARIDFAEIPMRDRCITGKLSPDGRFLVCLDPEWTLRLIDVSSGAPILERKNFGADWVGESLWVSPYIGSRYQPTFDIRPIFQQTIDLSTLETSMLDFPRDDQSFVAASLRATALELSLERDLLENAAIEFSPDGRFFLAIPERYPGHVVAWDLRQKAAVRLGGVLKKLNGYPNYYVTFTTDDRVLISPKVREAKSDLCVTAKLVAFPSGKVIAKLTVPAGQLMRAAESGSVIIRPAPPDLGLTAPGFPRAIAPIGTVAVKINTGNALLNRGQGLDIFDDLYVTDNAAGEGELRAQANQDLLAAVQLPGGELSGLRAVAASSDLSRLMISSQSRAAVWNLTTGAALMRFGPVNGGVFDSRQHLFLDVPASASQRREMADLDPEAHIVEPGPEIPSALVKQQGPYLIVVRAKDDSLPTYVLETHTYEDISLDVRDAWTMKMAWSREFPHEAPMFFTDPDGRYGMFIWQGRSDRVQHDPELRRRLAYLDRNINKPRPLCHIDGFPSIGWWNDREPRPTYLLKLGETIDMATGKSVSRILFDPGDPCLQIAHALPLGHAIAIEDKHNRVVTYDADSDQPRARVFGHLLAGDPVRARIAVAKEAGRVVIYDALTGDETNEFRFPAPVAFVRFRSDGLVLLAVTAEQETISLAVR